MRSSAQRQRLYSRTGLGKHRSQPRALPTPYAYGNGMVRFMKPSKSGTVNAVSPCAGL